MNGNEGITLKLVTALSAALVLAACAGTQEIVDEEAADEADRRAAQERESAEIDGLRDDEFAEFQALDDPDSPLSERVIYFDFDRYEVKSEYRELVREHARYLRDRPDLRVRLEGHTDERGSREYNIGLGDRRAQAVRRMLVLHGVSEDQIRTVSYGEERPAIPESNEDAWAANRRVEIDYIR
ncbi:peptidoglycan-associated lipoprotein Pal [Gammaproteobacteria bacterium AB-CW1]|uniref:Peptidoglycan-associated protein n=1 Tax=Natronospira elongata TaxID=3110268 RepID=A0AAP6MJ83_9GAMM|nr:peptidoglycan-associated lipoprotein Pal [Gammaproteobacteria bacterium AB-CW1]